MTSVNSKIFGEGLLTKYLRENKLSNLRGLDPAQSGICMVDSRISRRIKQKIETIIFRLSHEADTVDRLVSAEVLM